MNHTKTHQQKTVAVSVNRYTFTDEEVCSILCDYIRNQPGYIMSEEFIPKDKMKANMHWDMTELPILYHVDIIRDD